MPILTASKHAKYCSPVIPAQGPGGLASGGREPMVLNAMQLPHQGLMQSLPIYPSTMAGLNIGIITGLTETTNADGSSPVVEPEGCCDDFPQAGLLKMCEWCSPWGMFGRQSRVYSLCDDEQQYCDMPMQVVGDVINRRRTAASSGRGRGRQGGSRGGSSAPTSLFGGSANILNSTSDKAMYELAATFARDMAPQYFTGNPSAANGVYRQFKGIESIVNTGYTDAVSGTPCPGADALVISFPDATGIDKPCTNPAAFVELLTEMVHYSLDLAMDTGLGIIDGALVGPQWMRNQIIRILACGSGSCNCCDNAGAHAAPGVNIQYSPKEIRDEVNEMMQGSYIVIDGMPIRWIVDNSDTYTSVDPVTKQRTGRLFFSPITAMNGTMPLFYQQYRPWNTTEINKAFSQWAPDGFFSPEASPNGAWLLFKKAPQNLCLQIAGVTKRRLAHHAPYLSWVMTDLTFCSRTPLRDWNFDGGGRVEGPAGADCVGMPGDTVVPDPVVPDPVVP